MCTTSTDIGELAKALAKAQGEMQSAKFDGVNPFFSTKERQAKYATLAQVWDTCRKPLADNGLAIVQPVDVGDGGVIVRTRLVHASGQWIESALTMPVDKKTAQGVGSAITYGRRYGLSAMVGVVADEDDDGNAATEAAPPEAKPKEDPAAFNSTKFVAALEAANDSEAVKKIVAGLDKKPMPLAEKNVPYREAFLRLLQLDNPDLDWAATKLTALRQTTCLDDVTYTELIGKVEARQQPA